MKIFLKCLTIILFAPAMFSIPSCKEESKITILNDSKITSGRLDEFIIDKMDSLGLPGVSIAVINDNKIVYHRIFGVTSVDTREKVSEQTLFDAGSMSKPAFMWLVMKMVERGILDLDQPLYTYLPYNDVAYDDRYKLITARMILSHTSGFPNWRRANSDNRLDIKFTPGSRFLYSGEGFEYLALVIAHLNNISKNGLQELFEKEVSGPLHMKYAFFTWNDYVKAFQAKGHVDGKVAEGWGIDETKPDFYASYSLQTEAKSYANFLIALMNGEGLNQKDFDDIYRIQFPATTENEVEKRGLGIVIRSSEFGNEYLHGGYNLNFSSSFMFNKEKKFGYVFFTNCNKGMEFNNILENFLKN